MVKNRAAFLKKNPPQNYGVSPAIWDHTVFVFCPFCGLTQVNAPRRDLNQPILYLPTLVYTVRYARSYARLKTIIWR